MKLYPARWTLLLLLAMSGCSQRPTAPVWNVPELVGKPIDAVKQKIGTPQSETTLDTGVTQSTWQREGTTLVANWKPTNKRIREWTLVSRDEDHALREEEKNQLLLAGQLKESDPAYSVDWIEASQRPLFYTGVRVVPAPKTHSVQLRLSGSSAMVQVAYEATGAQGKSETFLTIAPWQESYTWPDDTQIKFSAVLQKALVPGQTNLKIEIVEDGQVIATTSASAGLIHCQAEL